MILSHSQSHDVCLSVSEMYFFWQKRDFLRVILRTVPIPVQDMYLNHNTTCQLWSLYISRIKSLIWVNKQRKITHNSVMYYAWMSGDRKWYVGKANERRDSFSRISEGYAARFSEHISSTLNRSSTAAKEHRYRHWRQWSIEGFRFFSCHLA